VNGEDRWVIRQVLVVPDTGNCEMEIVHVDVKLQRAPSLQLALPGYGE
jgi:hypothetical protein